MWQLNCNSLHESCLQHRLVNNFIVITLATFSKIYREMEEKERHLPEEFWRWSRSVNMPENESKAGDLNQHSGFSLAELA